MSVSSPQRLHALDALRGSALLLGIVFHAAISFMPGMFIWPVIDSQASSGFNLVFYVSHMFRMLTFFMLAGFFARMAYHRRGAVSFAIDRFKRVAMPLAVFWMPLFAAVIGAYIWGAIRANGGELPEDDSGGLDLGLRTFPLTHLWFLYLLVVFYVAAFAVKLLAALVDKNQFLRRSIDHLVSLMLKTPLGLIAIAAPMVAWYWYNPMWFMWFGIPTPDHGFIPNGGALIGYGSAFAIGWLIQRQSGLLEHFKNQCLLYLGIAIGLTVYSLSIVGVDIAWAPAAKNLDKLVYATVYTIAGWAWTFGLTGGALLVWSKESKLRRYIADSSYWLYLLHLPVLMFLQIAMADLVMPAPVKFALLLAITMSILLASYHFMVRNTFLGGWLNGRRYPVKDDTSRKPVGNSASLQA